MQLHDSADYRNCEGQCPSMAVTQGSRNPRSQLPWHLEILSWHLVFLRVIIFSLFLFLLFRDSELDNVHTAELLILGSKQSEH
jgi:hypothetical protein